MKAVLQRVTHAKVSVAEDLVAQISRPGILALIGVAVGDGPEQAHWIARKIAELKILREEQNLLEAGAPVLLVSQFTLLADTKKGRRPSWSKAAPGPQAEPLFNQVVSYLQEAGLEVQTGRFGADMQIELVNDGPVTITLQTPGGGAT